MAPGAVYLSGVSNIHLHAAHAGFFMSQQVGVPLGAHPKSKRTARISSATVGDAQATSP